MVKKLILISVFLFTACSLEYYPAVLHMDDKIQSINNINDGKLKRDGYFYTLNNYKEHYFIDAFILFDDGTVYYPRVFPLYTKSNDEYEHYYFKDKFNKLKKNKKIWGKYSIHNDTLKMKLFSGGGITKIKLVTVDYLIKNDSTLLLFNKNEESTYFFKELNKKPDSINWLTKKLSF